MDLDPKISAVPRITIGRLFSKKVPFLKLSVAFSISIPRGKAFTMSWEDQISAKESRNLVSRAEKTPSSYAWTIQPNS